MQNDRRQPFNHDRSGKQVIAILSACPAQQVWHGTSWQRLGTHQEGHGGAVHPSKVGCTRHGLQIVLPFLGVDSGTSQLPVVGLDVVTCHSSLHCCEGVSSYLQPPTHIWLHTSANLLERHVLMQAPLCSGVDHCSRQYFDEIGVTVISECAVHAWCFNPYKCDAMNRCLVFMACGV